MTEYVSIVLFSVFIHWLLFAQRPVAYILLNIQEDHSKPSKLLVKKHAVVLLKCYDSVTSIWKLGHYISILAKYDLLRSETNKM